MLPTLKHYRPSFVDHFFGNDVFDNFFGSNFPVIKGTMPAINIFEGKDNFQIEIASPGMKKEDFNIKLDNDLLTISSEQKMENEEKNGTFVRKEFNYLSFEKTFILPDYTDTEKIEATHNNGILTIVIPKKEEAKVKSSRQISIN